MEASLVTVWRLPIIRWQQGQCLLKALNGFEGISQDKAPPAQCLVHIPAVCQVMHSHFVHERQRALEIANRDLEGIEVRGFHACLKEVGERTRGSSAALVVIGERFCMEGQPLW